MDKFRRMIKTMWGWLSNHPEGSILGALVSIAFTLLTSYFPIGLWAVMLVVIGITMTCTLIIIKYHVPSPSFVMLIIMLLLVSEGCLLRYFYESAHPRDEEYSKIQNGSFAIKSDAWWDIPEYNRGTNKLRFALDGTFTLCNSQEANATDYGIVSPPPINNIIPGHRYILRSKFDMSKATNTMFSMTFRDGANILEPRTTRPITSNKELYYPKEAPPNATSLRVNIAHGKSSTKSTLCIEYMTVEEVP